MRYTTYEVDRNKLEVVLFSGEMHGCWPTAQTVNERRKGELIIKLELGLLAIGFSPVSLVIDYALTNGMQNMFTIKRGMIYDVSQFSNDKKLILQNLSLTCYSIKQLSNFLLF